MPPIAILDDDPTGSQTVHDVAIVMALDEDELRLDGETTFFLTNSRSLPEAPGGTRCRVRVAALRGLLRRRPRTGQRLKTISGVPSKDVIAD